MAAQLEALDVLELTNGRSLGVHEAGPMGMQVHDLGIAQLLGLEVPVHVVHDRRGLLSAAVPEGEVTAAMTGKRPRV